MARNYGPAYIGRSQAIAGTGVTWDDAGTILLAWDDAGTILMIWS